MNVGTFAIGLAFLILGILNIVQSTAKRLWLQRYFGTLQSFVLLVWLRSRFGAYGVRYFYMASGIGSLISGCCIIFVRTVFGSPIILIGVMVVTFVSAKYVLDWRLQSQSNRPE